MTNLKALFFLMFKDKIKFVSLFLQNLSGTASKQKSV